MSDLADRLVREMMPTPEETPATPPLWGATEQLEAIRLSAWSRLVSPWAVLGEMLARVVACVPPEVTLPPMIGGKASLNSIWAIVGPSGAGKGASGRVARELLGKHPAGGITPAQLGSGEGIIHYFAERKKSPDNPGRWITEMRRKNALFSVDEIDALVAKGVGRRGSTLLPNIRSAWSGAAIGSSTADQERNLSLEEDSYRAVFTVGVQPERAAPLLSDAAGGTPQRMVWVPALDPDMPEEDQPWCDLPLAPVCPTGRRMIPVEPAVVEEVRAQARARHRGESTGALDGHRALVRLKIATAMALLHGRVEVVDQWWQMAGYILAISDSTVADIRARISGEQEREARARGRARAIEGIAETHVLDEELVARASASIRQQLSSGPLTASKVRRGLTSRLRPVCEDALARLVSAGVLEAAADEYHGQARTTYRLRG